MFSIKTKARAVALLGLTMAATGCATQNFPTMGELSPIEAQLFDCQQLVAEYLRADRTAREIDGMAAVNIGSIAALPADLGVGNILGKSAAKDAAQTRMKQISLTLSAKQCPQQPLIHSRGDENETDGVVGQIASSKLVRGASKILDF